MSWLRLARLWYAFGSSLLTLLFMHAYLHILAHFTAITTVSFSRVRSATSQDVGLCSHCTICCIRNRDGPSLRTVELILREELPSEIRRWDGQLEESWKACPSGPNADVRSLRVFICSIYS